MRKEEQRAINEKVLSIIDGFNKHSELTTLRNGERLRTCSARVFETDRFYVLQSYNTIIALIDKETDTLYDFLRYVFGYTATSAQHINKFEKDYCRGKWRCNESYTYRPC